MPKSNETHTGPVTNSSIDTSGSVADILAHLDLSDTNRQTLGSNLTLSASDAMIQNIDPDGAKTITLPAESDGLMFIIGNRASGAEDITVENDNSTTIATVQQGDVGIFISDGTGWLGLSAPGGVT